MCFPITETTLQTVCIAKIKMLRNSVGKYVQAVLPNCKADFEGIINVTNSVILDDGTESGKQLTVAQACAWVAGATPPKRNPILMWSTQGRLTLSA